MKIITENGLYKFSIPVNLVDISVIQDFVDSLTYKNIVSKSITSEKDIEKL